MIMEVLAGAEVYSDAARERDLRTDECRDSGVRT